MGYTSVLRRDRIRNDKQRDRATLAARSPIIIHPPWLPSAAFFFISFDMATVTELITKFSFEGSTGPLEKYNAGLGKGVAALGAMTLATAASLAAVGKWATGVLAAEQPLINLAAQTGVAVEKIQELQFIAEVSNSSADALSSSLVNLSKKVGDAALKGSEDFARLGISVRDTSGHVKSADQVLSEVSVRFRQLGLSLSEQQYFSEALGLDASLITMLKRTSSEMSELSIRARELGVLSADQTKQAMEYNDTLTTMRFAMDGVRRLIAVGLVPEMKEISERFTKLLIDNKEWIVDGVKATIEILSDFMLLLGRTWPLLAAGTAAFVALKIATMGWAAALAKLQAIPIVAGITLAILAIDDLIVAFNGGRSVIADFFNEFFNYDIVKVIRNFVDGIQLALRGLPKILSGSFKEGFSDISRGLIDAFMAATDPIRTIYSNLFKWLKEMLIGILPDWVLNLAGIESVNDASLAPGGAPGLQTVNSRNIEQTVNMEIRTTDPERAGIVVRDRLQDQLRDAEYQVTRGGQ